MAEIQKSLFSLPEPPKKLSSHQDKIRFALEIYAARGLTLEAISSPKILGCSVNTLRGYC
jgi:hypothetical protein